MVGSLAAHPALEPPPSPHFPPLATTIASIAAKQLEARNPTPEPNEAAAALGGTWRLAYTSNSELIALLALQRLPLVTVGDITQTIDPLGQTVENRVELAAPLRSARAGWRGGDGCVGVGATACPAAVCCAC